MTKEAILQKLLELPDPVKTYVFDEEGGELNGRIIGRAGLSEAQRPVLFDLLKELFIRAVPAERLLDEVKKRFGLADEAKARQVAVDIAGFRLLPLDKWLGDVDGLIRGLGGNPSAYPTFRVAIAKRTATQAADEAIASSGVEVPEERLSHRLHDVAESFMAGVRTEPLLRDALVRDPKVGGLGLDPLSIDRLVEALKEEARSVIIEAAPAPATPVKTGVQAAVAAPAAVIPAQAGIQVPSEVESRSMAEPAAPPVPLPKAPALDAPTPEDEREIREIKETVLPARGASAAGETTKRIEDSVDELYAASGLKTDDEAFAKRVKTVIGNRLRDVRDQMETLEVMTQPKELGGLGLGQDDARQLLAAIQAKLRAVHEAHAVKVAEEKKEWVEKTQMEKVQADADEKSQQADELERLYQSIVSKSAKAKSKAGEKPPEKAPGTAAVPGTSGPEPVIAPHGAPPNLPIANLNPVPPAMRPPETVPLPAGKAPGGVAATSVQAPLTVVRPMQGAVMPAARSLGEGGRPKIEDVRSAAPLTGPIEDLRNTSLVDFRRLSKDPKEACLKIKDKVDLLKEQSFSKRNAGIAAWFASEVHRTYLDMMKEALDGKPLKDVIAGRQAARQPVLAQEEFQAVADLSRQLRY